MPFSPVIFRTLDFIKPIVTNATLPSLDGQDVRIPLITKTEFNNLRALGGYTKRDGLFGGIATLFHRIWNAVKAIFCQSDWQRAERSLCTLTKRLLPFAPTYLAENDANFKDEVEEIARDPAELKKFVQERMHDIIQKINKTNRSIKPKQPLILPVLDQIFSWFDVNTMNREPKLFEFVFSHFKQFQQASEDKKPSRNQMEQILGSLISDLRAKNFIRPEVTNSTIRITLEFFLERYN